MKSLLQKKSTRNNLITYGAVIVFYAVFQTLATTGSLKSLYKGLLVPICAYVILAVSLNLTVGILGELSLGHAGFMCIGAYSSVIFSLATHETIKSDFLRFLLALIIGGVCAAIFGIIIGVPILRLSGDYLAIVTLAFGEIIKNICNVLYIGYDSNGFQVGIKDSSVQLAEDGKMILKGAMGASDIPKDSTFTIGIILVLITLFVVFNFVDSRAGRAVMSIRDNRIAAQSTGINITKYKLLAFTISSFFAGIAGTLYAHNYSILTTKKYDYNTSIAILVFVVLGGMGNIRGSIIAALILTVLPEILRGFSEYRMLIYSVVLIAMMIYNSSPKLQGIKEKYSIKRILDAKKRAKALGENEKEAE
ncbi:MAG: branched-chain amino acid ABC transporter permease [Clostridiales bacterium]|nr:branched-chain amino acid ABC transporter permease [Clostridiales bacterium]